MPDPPESSMTPDEMLRRARNLVSALRTRQESCERQGSLPVETHQDFLAAGLYRILQPRCFGGYEFSLADFVRITSEISRGCIDSGWVLGVIAGQPASRLCLFAEEALREVYGDDGDCRAVAAASPGGTAIGDGDGYFVQGEWTYCSGCDVSTHFIGTVALLDRDTCNYQGPACILCDRKDYRFSGEWNMIGMQGTGSRHVVIDGLRIPAHRLIPFSASNWREPGTWPGHKAHANPLYQGSPLAAFEFSIYSTALGAAKGALDVYGEILRDRRWIMPPFPARFEMPELQQGYGDVQALIDTAEAALLGLAERYEELARRSVAAGGGFGGEDFRRIHRAGIECLELAWQAVDRMFRTAGSSAAARDAFLGRYFRGLAVLRTHISAQMDHTSANVGRLHFGLPSNGPM